MSQIDDLPPLREIIERHRLAAKKSLGQNFLLDLNLTMKIARIAGIGGDDTVIEIGPGPGGLTRALLASGAKKVIAIERDPRCMNALKEIGDHYPGKLDVIEGDALEVDLASLLDGTEGRIVANLPYNVATPLLTGWIEQDIWPPFWKTMTLMFQKEVGTRICANPGSKAYGRLGVLCGWRTHASNAFDLPPQAFIPPPKVTSSVIHFEPNPSPLPCQLASLTHVTKLAFGQRRKMLRASLKALGGESLLVKAGIDPTLRAEEINIEGFVRLANLI